MHITPTSLTINQLFSSGSEQYVIPSYQRRYSWHAKQVGELFDDIQAIEGADTHLLGSIVCLSGHHVAGINKLELVDGQQRLTTIAIVLECIAKHLLQEGEKDEAAEVIRLLSAKPLGGKPLRKLALDSIDASEFDRLVAGEAGDDFKNQDLVATFSGVREWLKEETLDEIGKFLYRLRNQAIVIRLDVSEAKDAFKLFETINNRGLRLSPTDIIKNFLLGNAARLGADHLEGARRSWTKLLSHLDETNSDSFFRYFLTARLKSRITASLVVPSFKTLFMSEVREAASLPEQHLYIDEEEPEVEEQEEGGESKSVTVEIDVKSRISFKDFLSHLVRSAKVYGELALASTGDARIDRRLRNLHMIKAIQTYGFLMHLRVGGCTDKSFIEVLKLTESLILRRHICRERANENEALFARLCAIDPKNPVKATRDQYREMCPSDDKFREDFASGSFSANIIDRARYCLAQIELSEHGEHDELDILGSEDVHVEHIIPQKIKTQKAKEEFGDWVSYLGDRAEVLHPKFVSRIGNLTIFNGSLNISASNNPFARKKNAYKESAILMTKRLTQMPQFKFKHVNKRSQELAKIAVGLWPKP